MQRTLRNAGVAFLRQNLAEAFPDNHLVQLRRPFKNEWDALAAAAADARSSGGTTTVVRDDYDLLSVSHFYTIFDAYFDKLFQPAINRGVLSAKPNRPKLLGALKAIKDFRDPLSHPVDEDVSIEEAVGVLSDVRQILLALGLKAKADQISPQITSLSQRSSWNSENVICVLPTQDSIYQDFIGRDSVLTELKALFGLRFAKRCLLAGDGGKGKSAVAYRFAQTVAAETAYFKMVIWISAKKRRFEAGRAVDIQNPDFTDLASAIDSLLAQYGPADPDLTLEEKRQLLLECLDDYPTLVIADDIDSVLDDSKVVSLFTFEIPNTASKVLLTSRRDIPGITSINIAGFTPVEAELFIHSRISTYQLDSALFTPDVVRMIREACDGSPLYIDDLIRLTRVVEPKKAAQAWAEKRGDEARKYALKRELDNLSMDAKSVLIAAVVSDQPASFAELHSVLNFSEDRLISSLTELQTLFLLPNASIVEGEQRYHINQNTKRLILSIEESTDLFKRIDTKSRALAGTLPSVGRDIISQLIRQAILFTSGGNFPKGEELLLNAIDKYPNAADLYGFLGYLYKGVNRTTDARIQFERAGKLKSKSEDTYLHWVKMELAEREYNSAVRAATLGIAQLPGSYKLLQLRLDAKYRVAEDHQRRIQPEKAERIWKEIIEEIEKILKPRRLLKADESEINAALFRRLVVCLEHLGDMPELNRRFAQWFNEHKDDPSIPRQREIFTRRRGGLFKG
ncbi:MAG: hypothetical protein WBE76_18090 [Terracidiphilus sp.]